jgi:hypothetical protein
MQTTKAPGDAIGTGSSPGSPGSRPACSRKRIDEFMKL